MYMYICLLVAHLVREILLMLYNMFFKKVSLLNLVALFWSTQLDAPSKNGQIESRKKTADDRL